MYRNTLQTSGYWVFVYVLPSGSYGLLIVIPGANTIFADEAQFEYIVSLQLVLEQTVPLAHRSENVFYRFIQ